MGDTVSDTCSLNKVIISRSKDFGRLIVNRPRINCETVEEETPDLPTQDGANNTIIKEVRLYILR